MFGGFGGGKADKEHVGIRNRTKRGHGSSVGKQIMSALAGTRRNPGGGGVCY